MAILKEDGDGFLGHPRAANTRIPPLRLASKVLCRRHNAMLEPYDATAKRLYLAIERAVATADHQIFLFNGHDVQGWMLKALLGMVAGKGAGANGTEMEFDGLEDWVPILFRRAALCGDPPGGSGLYFGMQEGDPVANTSKMRVAPLSVTGEGSVAGLELALHGVTFRLLVRSPDPQHPLIDGYSLRPRSFEIGEQGSLFMFSW